MKELDREGPAQEGFTQERPAQEGIDDEVYGDDENDPSPLLGLTGRRVAWVLGVLAVLVLLALIPPLINVGRYRRQIATSIGTSLGRPVHIDNVTLNVLPMPGFTLENFVVDEDPAFGAEPVIRAQEVRATLRMNSLWRRRVEFSRISLIDPSVNLVHLGNGQWNLEGILVQASHMPAAPTEQKGAGDAPRFPYIEATGARVNVKMGLEKLPFSLTDAEFALWLPEPKQWHLRLSAHPSRTDGPAMDTGTIRVEGMLGQAAMLAEVPVDLTGEWTNAPLGAVSRVLMGNDAGLRGEMTLTGGVRGKMGRNDAATKLELRQVRRADFVPARTLDANVSCAGTVTRLFHSVEQLRCAWPAGTDGGLTVTGAVPEVFRPASARLEGTVKGVDAAAGLELLRMMSPRISPAVTLSGAVTAELSCCDLAASAAKAGEFDVDGMRLGTGGAAYVDGDVSGVVDGGVVTVGPVDVELGGKESAALEVRADLKGYTIRLNGMVLASRLKDLAGAIAPFGDGLEAVLPVAVSPATVGVEAPVRMDVTATRAWGGTQSWSATAVKAPGRSKRRQR